MKMQSYTSPSAAGYGAGFDGSGQYVPSHVISVSTQNSFGLLHEWVGYSMDSREQFPVSEQEPKQMQLQWALVRSKRQHFNTGSPAAGTGQINFATLNVDEKLSHIVEKLNSLERSNNEILKMSQKLKSLQVKVDSTDQGKVNHELFLKVLAYKSFDIEARSRRCNLVFHGMSESKNENLSDEMRNFMWYEMGLTYDDFYIHRVHRLGSLYKAKQRNGTENP